MPTKDFWVSVFSADMTKTRYCTFLDTEITVQLQDRYRSDSSNDANWFTASVTEKIPIWNYTHQDQPYKTLRKAMQQCQLQNSDVVLEIKLKVSRHLNDKR